MKEEGQELGLPGRQGDRAVRTVEHARPLVDVEAGKLAMPPLPEGEAIAEPGQLPFRDPVVDVQSALAGIVAHLAVKAVEKLLVER